MKTQWSKKIIGLPIIIFCIWFLAFQGTIAESVDQKQLKVQSDHIELIQNGEYPKVQTRSKARSTSGVTLTQDQETAIVEGIKNFQQTIDVRTYNWDIITCQKNITYILNTHPELIQLTGETWYSYTSEKVYNVYFEIVEGVNKQTYADTMKKIDAVCCQIMENVDLDKMTDMEVVLYIHDWLSGHITYSYDDKDSTVAHNLQGALLRRHCVCQGYAEAFCYIIKKYTDIDTAIVTSKKACHAWNAVYLDGKWYHLDITWDKSMQIAGYASHDYFLLSTEELLSSEPERSDYQVIAMNRRNPFTAANTSYENGFWNKTYTASAYKEGYWYYVDYMKNKLIKYDSKKKTENVLYGFIKWKLPGKMNDYYEQSFSNPSIYGDKLYFNTSRDIMVYDLSRETYSKYSPFSDDTQIIFGSYIIDNTFVFSTASNANASMNTNQINVEEMSHVHIWKEGDVVKKPTCNEEGEQEYTCTKCKKTKIEKIKALGHETELQNVKKATCTSAGYTGDKVCKVCGDTIEKGKTIPATGHKLTNVVVKKASFTANGSMSQVCSVCKKTIKNVTIPKVSKVTLSCSAYNYDGKIHKPSVSIYVGTTKLKTTDYTVSYSAGSVNPGTYKATITLKKTGYSGTKTLTYTINLKGTSLTSVRSGSKSFTAVWSKQTSYTTGYDIQYSANSKFSSPKSIKVKRNTQTTVNVSKLKAKAAYYVRIRTYKLVGSKAYYSKWSSAKKVITR